MEQEDLDEYQHQAHELVDEVIESALSKLKNELWLREKSKSSINIDLAQNSTIVYREPPKYENFEVQNIEWLTIEEFSPKLASGKIDEFIKTWEYQDSWKYCVNYLGKDDFEFDVRHRFRVRWSIPTRRKPIPRATACVYFTFEVSKIKPKNFPVDVLYVFETNRLVHKPGFSRFREKWLKDIIESKVILMDEILF